MPKKRSRDRQLAKLAARRQWERRRRQRRRNAVLGSVAALAVAAGLVVGGQALLGDEQQLASPTPSESPGPEVACGGKVPKAAGQEKPTFRKPPEMAIDPGRTYAATLETSCGAIRIELDARDAPETVNSFVFLANEGFFDGLVFHRVDDSIDVIQGGDPTGTGEGGPGYELPDELTGEESYGPGVVAMANSGPDSAGSQFFIVTGRDGRNLDDNPAYTIFGRVVKGLDVARTIQALPIVDPAGGIAGQRPVSDVYIERVTIQERGR
jgi:cyclophilin family peptidyl-prolyl cis-trans isomerase